MNKCFIFLGMLLVACSTHQPVADAIYFNGNIYTLNPAMPTVHAVAVTDGRIVSLGNKGEVIRHKGPDTRLVDLKGMTMTPGFIDSHAHFMGIGFNKINLDLSGVKSYEALCDMVRETAKKLPPGQWILGRGWYQDKWDSISGPVVHGFPVNTMLNEASPSNPVFLRHASGHAGLANTQAMSLAGITRDTPDPEGGDIIRSADGQPTGIFNEMAQSLINRVIPKADHQRNQQALEAAVEECLRNGITSLHDAGVNQQTIDLYQENIKKGKLKVRIYAMLSGDDSLLLQRYFKQGPLIGYGNNFLTVRAVKLFMDGALGSRGAWLLQPYSDMPDETGHATHQVATIERTSKAAMKHGFQVGTHAIGDRANREVLNAYENAFKSMDKPSETFRFRIEHAQHISLTDIQRFGKMGVIAAMQAIHLSSDRPWAIHRLGQQRIEEGAYVWQKLIKSGAYVINGTDAPVEPVNPIHCFYASVSRKTLEGKPPGGYEPDQKMTREQALRSYTLDAAYGAFEESLKGSIEKGKLADFTVFDKDIMKIPEAEILQTNVVMTIVGGEIVYQNATLSQPDKP